MAFVVLLFFVCHVSVPEKFAKTIRFISPSMFGVYLLHDATDFGKFLYQIPEHEMISRISCHPIVAISVSAIVVFVLCLLVDLMRRGIASCVSCVFDRSLNV